MLFKVDMQFRDFFNRTKEQVREHLAAAAAIRFYFINSFKKLAITTMPSISVGQLVCNILRRCLFQTILTTKLSLSLIVTDK